MPIDQSVVVIINSLFLIVFLILLIYLFKNANDYNWAYGISEKQDPARIKLLKTIVAMIALGFIAAIVNIVLFSLI